METISAFEFASLSRRLAVLARGMNLVVPSFRTPPRRAGVLRSFCRYPDGTFLVSVVIHRRSRTSVVGDMIDGILLVNDLAGASGADIRQQLFTGSGSDSGNQIDVLGAVADSWESADPRSVVVDEQPKAA